MTTLRPSAVTVDRSPSVTTVVGAVILIAGTALPWFSTLAGLQTLTGLDGPYGRLLAGGGIIAAAIGVVGLRGQASFARRTVALLGFLLLGASSLLLLSLVLMYREAAADPLLLARLGPGAFVATAGAGVILSSTMLSRDAAAAAPQPLSGRWPRWR